MVVVVVVGGGRISCMAASGEMGGGTERGVQSLFFTTATTFGFLEWC